MKLLILSCIILASCVIALAQGPNDCSMATIQNSDCSDKNKPLTLNCCQGYIFWSYPTNICYLKLTSNCTASGKTILSLKADYTANLYKDFMSGTVFEESANGSPGTMRAYLGGGSNGNSNLATTGAVQVGLPTQSAFLTLHSGPKLNLYGVAWTYSFSEPQENN